MKELITILESQTKNFEEFKAANEKRFTDLEKDYNERLKEANRFSIGGDIPRTIDSKTFKIEVDGKVVPCLTKSQKFADLFGRASRDDEGTLADYVRHQMGLKTVVSGTGTVPSYIGNQIIDLVRANSVVIDAGAVTIPIDGPTALAKITGDPTVYQHTEGTADITESDMTLGSITVNPKALVAAVPLSAEIVADSVNLDSLLNMSLASAFAVKLDTLCIAKILADTNIPTSTAGQDPATWAGVLAAITEALAANQQLPASLIGSQADFIARASQLASTAGSWLGKPPILAGMAELFTTGINAGTAVFGDWLRGFGVAMRQDLRYEVVRFSKHTSYTHILVAHARVDGYVLQPGRLFIQQKTVV